MNVSLSMRPRCVVRWRSSNAERRRKSKKMSFESRKQFKTRLIMLRKEKNPKSNKI
jgi:hypothetical protein